MIKYSNGTKDIINTIENSPKEETSPNKNPVQGKKDSSNASIALGIFSIFSAIVGFFVFAIVWGV